MRNILISLSAAAASLAFAAPASAQWAQPQGHAYGYYQNHGQVRVLHVRIQQLQRHIVQLDRRGIIRSREAQRLYRDARALEGRLIRQSHNGLTLRQRNDIQLRLARLEQRVAIASRSNHRWGYDPRGYDPRWGYRGW
ncbi:MAG TPA: hypothetical protein VM346_01070 [Sphingomicrobium sp.]|nr:hypothetical protein [Sphingomicrobium sp.]